MYLYCASGVLRYEFLIYNVMNFTPIVGTLLLSNNFNVSKSAVGVPKSPGYYIPSRIPLTLFGFLGFVFRQVSHHPDVGDILESILRYLLFCDEGNYVGALDTDFHSLGQTAYLTSKRYSLCIFVLWGFP